MPQQHHGSLVPVTAGIELAAVRTGRGFWTRSSRRAFGSRGPEPGGGPAPGRGCAPREGNFPELEMSNCFTRRIRPGPKPKMSGRIWTAPNLDLDVKSAAWDRFWFIFKKLIVSLPWVAKCRKNGHGSSRLKSVRILFCSSWRKTFFPGCREWILPHLQARENHWKLWSE